MDRGSINRTIGRNVRRQRERCGLSTDQLAALLGVSRRRMGQYEGGTAALTCEELAWLATVFRCSPDDLCH